MEEEEGEVVEEEKEGEEEKEWKEVEVEEETVSRRTPDVNDFEVLALSAPDVTALAVSGRSADFEPLRRAGF